jgi:cytochrome c oxidase subunit 3/cytochrome o ubiquinol oxidase subunit 3
MSYEMAATSSPHERDALIPEPSALGPVHWGMLAFLLSEAAFFSTLIVVYIALSHSDQSGPTPAMLSLPLVIGTTICLLSSSATIHQAERRLRAGAQRTFMAWWLATIVLGVLFLSGTAYEWHDLIVHEGLTIGRNLFGTTFYTLVGFHALHVTAGVIAMSIVLALAVRGQISARNTTGAEMVAWYWHFVDGVWVVVFTVVYLIGR